jgi:hypothetical protein
MLGPGPFKGRLEVKAGPPNTALDGGCDVANGPALKPPPIEGGIPVAKPPIPTGAIPPPPMGMPVMNIPGFIGYCGAMPIPIPGIPPIIPMPIIFVLNIPAFMLVLNY